GASIKQPAPNFVIPTIGTIDNKGFNVILANPPAEIAYKYQLPNNAFLDFGVTMNPECWSPDKGDGVTFEVLIEAEGEEKSLYKRAIDPKSIPADRKVFWESIDLSLYSGKDIQLKFKTDPMLSPCSDWAFWVAPRITTLTEAKAINPLSRYTNVWSKEGCNIYENKDVLPRAFFSFGAIASSSIGPDYDINIPLFPALKTENKRILGMLASDGFESHKYIIVEGAAPIVNKENRQAKPVAFEKLNNHKYLYKTDSNQEGYLCVSDTYDPGWSASVDGETVQIIKANHAFRAVYLPPGNHTVIMSFTPKGYVLGRNLTLCGLVVLVVFVLTQTVRWKNTVRG
ncbi:MAG: YfhO family protein, partial [Candidatus Omnitrophota bacterium]